MIRSVRSIQWTTSKILCLDTGQRTGSQACTQHVLKEDQVNRSLCEYLLNQKVESNHFIHDRTPMWEHHR